MQPRCQTADTWEWDGATWNQRPVSGPAGGHGPGRFVFQPDERHTVLVGADGRWALDASGWQRASTAPPPATTDLFFDGRERGIVSLSRSTESRAGQFLNRWVLVNGMWSVRTGTGGPPSPYTPSRNLRAAYDVGRQTTVVFGVADQATTWEFDGNSWLEREPRTYPRQNGVLLYDSARQKVMLHDDIDTWVFLP